MEEHGLFHTHEKKIAEGGRREGDRNVFVGGRAWALMDARRFMEEQRRERVGRTPPN